MLQVAFNMVSHVSTVLSVDANCFDTGKISNVTSGDGLQGSGVTEIARTWRGSRLVSHMMPEPLVDDVLLLFCSCHTHTKVTTGSMSMV